MKTAGNKTQKGLTNHEIATLAVYLIGGDAQYVDTEDVAVKANEIDEVITATEPLNPSEILSGSEQIMFRVLKEHGPVLQRPKFEQCCLDAGMNQHSFWVFLTYCPIVERCAMNGNCSVAPQG
jgi:hypothetical protein